MFIVGIATSYEKSYTWKYSHYCQIQSRAWQQPNCIFAPYRSSAADCRTFMDVGAAMMVMAPICTHSVVYVFLRFKYGGLFVNGSDYRLNNTASRLSLYECDYDWPAVHTNSQEDGPVTARICFCNDIIDLVPD
jgi:hypothetical protein